jgi:iron complex outermembrane receptor protein
MEVKLKNLIIAFLLVGALTIHSNSLYSNETEAYQADEIIVTSSYIDSNLSDLDDPIHILSGDDPIFDTTLSLGESLDNLLGIQSSDFGSAVGHPIIRGLSGSRVRIMNNGKTLRDVSTVGDDHMNEVDLNDIQQIEIVRGPSSLLYSSGAVGGIVNIIDNTIARQDFDKARLNIGLESQSVNDGEAGSFSFQNNIGGFNITLAYKDSEFDNYDIPNGAIIHSEEEHHD